MTQIPPPPPPPYPPFFLSLKALSPGLSKRYWSAEVMLRKCLCRCLSWRSTTRRFTTCWFQRSRTFRSERTKPEAFSSPTCRRWDFWISYGLIVTLDSNKHACAQKLPVGTTEEFNSLYQAGVKNRSTAATSLNSSSSRSHSIVSLSV